MQMLGKHLRMICALSLAWTMPACDDDPTETPPAVDAAPAPDPEPTAEPDPDPEPTPEPDPDPEPTPVDPARSVQPEHLLDGPVAIAAPLDGGQVLAQAPESIALVGPEGTTDFGGEAGALYDAARVDGELLVATSAGLFARVDDALMLSPLGALLDGVTGLDITADGAMWLLDNSGLHVYRDGQLSGVDPGPMGVGPMTAVGAWADTPALWVVGDEALYAVGFADDGLQAWELTPEAPISAVAVNDLDGVWIAADGALSHLAADGTWNDIILPFAVAGLAAHPAAPDVWIVGDDGGLWQLREGRIRPIEGAPAFAGLRGEFDGSVLLYGDGGLDRIRPGRFLAIAGIDDGAIVDRSVELTIAATNPELIAQMTWRLDGGPSEALDGPPWAVTIEPGPVPEGAHTVEVAAEYEDGERLVAELSFTVQGPPTWESDISPLFVQHCDACHGERGFAHRMETMEVWIDEFDDIVDAIVNNRMPLPPNPMVPSEQLDLIRAWGETGYLRSWP